MSRLSADTRKRLEAMASSSVVGADIRAALAEIDQLQGTVHVLGARAGNAGLSGSERIANEALGYLPVTIRRTHWCTSYPRSCPYGEPQEQADLDAAQRDDPDPSWGHGA